MTSQNTQIARYGSWRSPITSEAIVADIIRLGEIAPTPDAVYWVEGRPQEGGRNVVVRRTADGRIEDVTPAEFNVRTRVHEYGGGAFLVDGETVYFVNFADGRLYRQVVGGEPEAITPEGQWRYADFAIDRPRDRLLGIREDHTGEGEAVNTIVGIGLDGTIEVLVSGNDFYASPCLSPDGTKLAWLTWNHPQMPWDGTELWVAEIREDGSLGEAQFVSGGTNESVFQPQWSPDGVLYFVSDRADWWNLYRWQNGAVEPLYPLDAEFATPQWVFGMSTCAFDEEGRLVCTYTQQGTWQLAILDPATPHLQNIETPYTEIAGLKAIGNNVLFLGASPTVATAIVQLNLETGQHDILRQSSSLDIDPGYISIPQPIEFPTENGLTAYAFYYPPTNKDYAAPEGEKPPLLVKSHGGPTASTSTSLRLSIQYWTSRGFAFLDVNYGGSTGYGRTYRQRLQGNWGIVDVDDCVNGARYLADRGWVDGERMAISGGSAGGYTTLAALTFRDVFKAGASYYGISDLEVLATDTHKFESRYLDGLIGAYPEQKQLYIDRSPIHFTDRLSCPVIFFQGLEDKVVPPNQAEMMVEALRQKGLPVAYVPFEGEQHGFRKAENIKRALDGEFYFYSRIFGYDPAEDLEPIEIENLEGHG
ncbi:MAG TPA: S9 family peptidase [Oscillatoriales cyanobacterium M59_W2019_021]|nr:S9 family peptidase [Oscillatoriales cyanobacterium M4454_W2019_049]HIK53214.1 S9 family peptidase [Oscillatoriales cyanobacterium M59_W2019_021]